MLLLAPSVQAATIEREFQFSPDRFALRKSGEITSVAVKGAAPSVAAGQPELPWIDEQIELPPGTRVSAIQVTSTSTSAWADHVRLPAAWTFSKDTHAVLRSTPDAAAFSRPGFQPEQVAQVGMQGWQRGRSVASLRLCPVR